MGSGYRGRCTAGFNRTRSAKGDRQPDLNQGSAAGAASHAGAYRRRGPGQCTSPRRSCPRPVPVALVVKNGSKMHKLISSGMPGPVSSTSSRTPPGIRGVAGRDPAALGHGLDRIGGHADPGRERDERRGHGSRSGSNSRTTSTSLSPPPRPGPGPPPAPGAGRARGHRLRKVEVSPTIRLRRSASLAHDIEEQPRTPSV